MRISVEDGFLVVSNPLQPLLEPQIGTGIGLENLKSRYELMLDRTIEIEQTDTHFIVRLPLVR